MSGAFSQEAQHWSQALLVVGALLGAPQRRHMLDKLKGPVCVRHNNVKQCFSSAKKIPACSVKVRESHLWSPARG